jgi:succinate dehydrogenase / fumarate reductase iron-sulfur subunit
VCPEDIHITDNAIIPLKERIVTRTYDPIAWALRRMRGKSADFGAGEPEPPSA